MRATVILGIAVLSFATASNAGDAAHLTLKEVAQKVVLTNPEVLSKWHAFKASEGEADIARAGFFPKLDVTTGSGRETLKQPGVADRQYTRSGYTLTLSQMLYDGFATSSDVKRMNKARLTRYFELVDSAENAALEAGRAYYDVLRYRLLMYLAENNYIEHRASYEQLLRRLQAGAGRRVDVEHAAGRLALAELNLNTEAANLHDVMARYMRLVGDRPPPVMFGPARLARDFPASEQEALQQAFRLNPTLRAAIENAESAQHDLDVRRAAFHPKVDVRVRNESTQNYQGTAGMRQNNVAELVLSYNLFNGGADMARQRVYADRRSQALDLRDKSCRDVRQTLSIAYNDVLRLRAQLANVDLQVSSIEKTRDAYKAQFNIGQRSLLDLLDTENELLNARRTAVNADIDLALAFLRTQAGIGRLLGFLGLKRVGADESPDASELAPVAEGDICPPEAPRSYLVDLDALTARALAMLDGARKIPPPPARPLPAPNPPVSAPLSYPPPMPSVGASPAAMTAATVAAAAAPDVTPPPATDRSVVAANDAPPAAKRASPGVVLTERVKNWAAAWSAKDYSGYMTYYAPSFVPADGASRDRWARARERRLATPQRVHVAVSNFRLNQITDSAFVAEFEQSYRSDSFNDRTLKMLTWIRVGDQWLIEREESRPLGGRASPGEAS